MKATVRVHVYVSGEEETYESSLRVSVPVDLGDVSSADFATLVTRDLPQRLRDLLVSQKATRTSETP